VAPAQAVAAHAVVSKQDVAARLVVVPKPASSNSSGRCQPKYHSSDPVWDLSEMGNRPTAKLEGCRTEATLHLLNLTSSTHPSPHCAPLLKTLPRIRHRGENWRPLVRVVDSLRLVSSTNRLPWSVRPEHLMPIQVGVSIGWSTCTTDVPLYLNAW
jgi:hypothetical protein